MPSPVNNTNIWEKIKYIYHTTLVTCWYNIIRLWQDESIHSKLQGSWESRQSWGWKPWWRGKRTMVILDWFSAQCPWICYWSRECLAISLSVLQKWWRQVPCSNTLFLHASFNSHPWHAEFQGPFLFPTWFLSHAVVLPQCSSKSLLGNTWSKGESAAGRYAQCLQVSNLQL